MRLENTQRLPNLRDPKWRRDADEYARANGLPTRADIPSQLTEDEINDAVSRGFFKVELLGKDSSGKVTYDGLPIDDLERLDQKSHNRQGE